MAVFSLFSYARNESINSDPCDNAIKLLPNENDESERMCERVNERVNE